MAPPPWYAAPREEDGAPAHSKEPRQEPVRPRRALSRTGPNEGGPGPESVIRAASKKRTQADHQPSAAVDMLPGDVADVAAMQADVGQLAVGEHGELLQRGAVAAILD